MVQNDVYNGYGDYDDGENDNYDDKKNYVLPDYVPVTAALTNDKPVLPNCQPVTAALPDYEPVTVVSGGGVILDVHH